MRSGCRTGLLLENMNVKKENNWVQDTLTRDAYFIYFFNRTIMISTMNIGIV
jgi:hypothetical protein